MKPIRCVIGLPRDRVFWRANRCGYTENLLAAGLYDKREADRIRSGLGVERDDTVIPLSDAIETFATGANPEIVAALALANANAGEAPLPRRKTGGRRG